MEKRIKCRAEEAQGEVIKILKSVDANSAITVNDLMERLRQKFVISSEELCEIMNTLSSECKINVTFVPGAKNIKCTECLATVGKIALCS